MLIARRQISEFPVQPLIEKYSDFQKTQISRITPAVPTPGIPARNGFTVPWEFQLLPFM
jgi:hypothetical protein